MEGSEESAKNDYASYDEYPDLQQIARDEDEHEQRLIALINEERLEYMGSVVLGLSRHSLSVVILPCCLDLSR